MNTALDQRNRSDLAFENLPEPVLVVDEEGRLDRLNHAASLFFGPGVAAAVERGEAVSRALPWLDVAVSHVLAGADEAGIEAEASTADGRRSVCARVRRLRGGLDPSGAVVLVEDLSGRRLLEARLRLAGQDEAVEALAADLAHEVNNPLACVVSGLAFVASEHARLSAELAAELGEAQEALEEVRAAALRVGRIVRSLETFGRPGAVLGQALDLGSPIVRQGRS